MKNTALETLRGKEEKEYAQAIVLLTAKGNKYAAFVENVLTVNKKDEKALIEKLEKAEDTKVEFLLCLWQEGALDLPSYDFRKMLIGLNPQNTDSAIFVMKGNGPSVIELGITVKA